MFRRFERSMVRAAVALSAALVVAATPPAAARQAQALPTGRDLADRFIAAIGGAGAYRAVNSLRAQGTFDLPAQGITGTVDVFSARPSNIRIRVEINGVGRVERGYDGKVGWSLDPIAGPALVTGRQLRELIDDAHFDGPLHPADQLKELTTVEQTTFDGRPAHKVRVVFTSGTELFEYFEVSTGLLIGSEGSREMPGGGIVPRVSIMRDYKPFGAILQPTTLVQQTLGLEQVIRLTSFEYNGVAADAFVPPAEVLALIKPR